MLHFGNTLELFVARREEIGFSTNQAKELATDLSIVVLYNEEEIAAAAVQRGG